MNKRAALKSALTQAIDGLVEYYFDRLPLSTLVAWGAVKFDPDQPRDETGRWTGDGGNASDGAGVLAYSGHSQTVTLSDTDEGNLSRAMSLESDAAKAMLDRAGYTKEEAIAKIEEARRIQENTPSTRDQYVDENGNYTPERQALHDEIEERLLIGAVIGDPPTLLVTGGLPGSGKSHVLKQDEYRERLSGFVTIDSDNIKEMLAESDGVESLGALAQSYHAEADDIISSIVLRATGAGYNIGLDVTMKNEGKTEEYINYFRSLGYTTEVAFIDLKPESAMIRAIGRYLEGGRFVDPQYIASHDLKNAQTARAIRDYVDVWRYWDNNVPFGKPPILQEHTP